MECFVDVVAVNARPTSKHLTLHNIYERQAHRRDDYGKTVKILTLHHEHDTFADRRRHAVACNAQIRSHV